MDQIKAMRTFARVIDTGSFVNASRALDIAPAAVTRMVAELEAQLGARLMTRTTRSLALTQIGERYLDRVRTILREVDDATAMVRQAHDRPQGAVRVLAPSAFAAHQLPQRLVRFHHMHPEVTVELTTAGPLHAPDEGHDVTIVAQQQPLDGDFVAHRLAHAAVVMCATPGYLQRQGRPLHPGELARHRLLLPPSARPLRRVSFTRVDGNTQGERVNVEPSRGPLSTSSDEMNLAGALAGIGIAALPTYAVERALADGTLQQVLPQWRLADVSIWACMPSRKHVPLSTRAFMDFLLQEFGGADAAPWATAAATCATPSAAPAA
jgi:DNA-binding transcriptional LysR family regulator